MFITEPSALGALCPSTGFSMPCMGSTCLMGWRWQSNATMEIGVTKDKNPPPGEGWEEHLGTNSNGDAIIDFVVMPFVEWRALS